LSIEERERVWRGWLGGSNERRSTLVADADGEIVGFVSIGPARGDGTRPDAGELDAIYLLPDCWGLGIGRALMSEALGELRRIGFTTAVLWVLADNPRARRFYERGGWRLNGATRTGTHLGTDTLEVRYALELSTP
jgi:GNAT superfamily N-acetyltransferase